MRRCCAARSRAATGWQASCSKTSSRPCSCWPGRSARTEIVVEADTAVKPTQYLRQETDLSAVLGGVTVNLVREYYSLSRGASRLVRGGRLLCLRRMIGHRAAEQGKPAHHRGAETSAIGQLCKSSQALEHHPLLDPT